MVKVIWTKRAFGQLERNIKYIKEEQGISYAEIVLNKILSSTSQLEGTPKMGRELNHYTNTRNLNIDS